MTGFQLKLLAMLAMTADHIGAVFFPEIPLLRWIGRLAMPVLCFFIGEGLRHTRSPRRYLLRLTGFALLSELPFDLAFYGGIEWGHQNVYFTLALGLLALWAIQSRGMEGWLLALTAALAAELLGCDYGMYGVLLILLLIGGCANSTRCPTHHETIEPLPSMYPSFLSSAPMTLAICCATLGFSAITNCIICFLL